MVAIRTCEDLPLWTLRDSSDYTVEKKKAG